LSNKNVHALVDGKKKIAMIKCWFIEYSLLYNLRSTTVHVAHDIIKFSANMPLCYRLDITGPPKKQTNLFCSFFKYFHLIKPKRWIDTVNWMCKIYTLHHLALKPVLQSPV
jgi:hypothetical protein